MAGTRRVDVSKPHVSSVIDRTRTRTLRLSADDVTEDEIEKPDTVLAGLAYQYATEQSADLTVIVSDAVAEAAIEDVLAGSGVGDTPTVVHGRSLLQSLLDRQFGR